MILSASASKSSVDSSSGGTSSRSSIFLVRIRLSKFANAGFRFSASPMIDPCSQSEIVCVISSSILARRSRLLGVRRFSGAFSGAPAIA